MASVRFTFTLEESLVEWARELRINISAAARDGVAAAVLRALADADRAAYRRGPEQPDSFWVDAETWSEP